MPQFEPRSAGLDPRTPSVDESAPEVPPQLGQLLQQLFVALEDYMNAPFQAMANVASEMERECRRTVTEIGSTLRDAHWTTEDTLLLLSECLRRLKVDQHTPQLDARSTRLLAHFPQWLKES
jgi:hypothetical protein